MGFTPFDSSESALWMIFWVGIDQSKCWAAKSRKRRTWQQVALQLPPTVSRKLQISRVVLVAWLWCCTPFDSSWTTLSNIFWVRVDAVKRSSANGRKLWRSRQMALRLPPFVVNLRDNASSDRFATKRRRAEHSKGYRLMYQHFRFDVKLIHFQRFKEDEFGVGIKSRINSLLKFNSFL